MESLFDAIFRGFGGGESKTLPTNTSPTKAVENPADKAAVIISTGHSSETTSRSDTSEVSAIIPHSRHPAHVAAIVSPPRDLAHVSDTPHTSFDTSASWSSPGVDISFGSQPIPFIYRRKLEDTITASPVKPSILQVQAILANKALGGCRPYFKTVSEGSSEGSELSVVIDGRREPQLSSWRKDQLKYQKKPRLAPDATLKPIPILHGPLSLPYARNPSGVDATVADDSAYFSNLYGLRVSDKGESRSQFAAAVSYPRAHENEDIYNATPQVVRNPQQMLGMLPSLESKQREEKPLKQLRTSTSKSLQAIDIARDILRTKQKDTSNSITVPPESVAAKEVPLRDTPDVLPPSVRLRAQLGVVKPKHALTPIPGSPAEDDADPFFPLFERAFSIQVLQGDEPADPDPPGFSGTQAAVSRADVSDNWRDKSTSVHGVAQAPPAVRVTDATPPSDKTDTTRTESSIMTIDSLFERFSTGEGATKGSHKVKFNPPPSTGDPVIKETSVTPFKGKSTHSKAAKGSPFTPSPLVPLGESKRSNISINSPPNHLGKSHVTFAPKVSTAAAKGTPNAGKLLKKGVSGRDLPQDNDPQATIVVADRAIVADRTAVGETKTK